MAYRAHLRTEHLRALCDRSGITVTDLADAIGMDPSSAYRVIKGKTYPSNAFIAGLAVIFGEDRLTELLRFAHEDEPARDKRFAPVLLRKGEVS